MAIGQKVYTFAPTFQKKLTMKHLLFYFLLTLCLPCFGLPHSEVQNTFSSEVFEDSSYAAVILLPSTLITPNDENPSHYVLRQVWEHADTHRQQLTGYQADLNIDMGINDVSFIINVLPKRILFLIKSAAFVTGYRKVLNLILQYPDLKAKLSFTRTYQKKKFTDSRQQILFCNHKLSSKEAETLQDNKLIKQFDIFESLYGEDCEWGRNGYLKDSMVLVGSYELENKTIDVLRYARSYPHKPTVADSTTTHVVSVELHIVEGDWGILKAVVESAQANSLRKCRDLGGGLYMPTEATRVFSTPTLKAEQMPAFIEETEAIDTSNMSKQEKKTHEAAIKELRKRRNEGLEIGMFFKYNIQYRK